MAWTPPEPAAQPLDEWADSSPPSVPLAVSNLPPPKPPAVPRLSLTDPKASPPDEAPFPLPLASAARRILARLLFLVGLALAGGVGFAVLVFAPKSVTRDPMMTWLLLAVPPVVYLLANAAMLARTGQDVGKRYLGVRVVNADGSKATEKTALLKRDALTFLIGLTGVGLVYWLIDAFSLFTRGGRTLHDRIAGTRVVRG